MTTQEALHRHLVDEGILAPGSAPEDRYAEPAIWLRLGPLRIPLPILNPRGPILLHDVHHMIAGYAPDWTGELELASWELASGGCDWHLLYWVDRITFCLVGLLVAPRATGRALRRGWHHRNLFGRDASDVMRHDVSEVRGWVLAPNAGNEAPC